MVALTLIKMRTHPYLREVVYVWDLKQQLNQIYRKQRKIEPLVEENDPDAITIMYFFYRIQAAVRTGQHHTMDSIGLKLGHWNGESMTSGSLSRPMHITRRCSNATDPRVAHDRIDAHRQGCRIHAQLPLPTLLVSNPANGNNPGDQCFPALSSTGSGTRRRRSRTTCRRLLRKKAGGLADAGTASTLACDKPANRILARLRPVSGSPCRRSDRHTIHPRWSISINRPAVPDQHTH